MLLLFQSTHPVRGATYDSRVFLQAGIISIHAPRAGCDTEHVLRHYDVTDFNPRTPCGVRPPAWRILKSSKGFQSTHPVRGATAGRRSRASRPADFNPRTPCGVRPASACRPWCGRAISIHAPRAGCDFFETVYDFAYTEFQSTHPVRGATAIGIQAARIEAISIHAPRAGCDSGAPCRAPGAGGHFNPRTPCGVRR